MSRQLDSHLQMANYLSHIGYLIKNPGPNKTGLKDLLRLIRWEPMKNIHPITKETCEQIIHYITEVAVNDEQPTYNRNMELLSKTLEDITKIILSEPPQKRINLLNLYINTEREAQLQDKIVNTVKTTIQAVINLLFKTTRARTQPPEASQNEGGDQEVPIQREQTEEEVNHLH